MKFCCIICSEYCLESEDVSATNCGHLFHAFCLTEWLKQSYTCPQCRNPIARSKGLIKKIYFEPGPEPTGEENVDELKNKLNFLEAQLMSSKATINEGNERDKTSQLQIANLLESQKDATTNCASMKRQLETLKEQSFYLKNEYKALNDVRQQNERLSAKMKEYDTINKLINDSSMEIEQSFKDGFSGTTGKQWSVMCGVLKKTLNQANSENQQLRIRIKNLTLEFNKLKKSQVIARASSPAVGASSRPPRSNKHEDSFDDIKIVKEISKEGKENLPILKLPLKSRSTAAMVANLKEEAVTRKRPGDYSGNHAAFSVHDFNIMKRRGSLKIKPSAAGSASQGYDGLGGHSKPDLYPTGKRQVD